MLARWIPVAEMCTAMALFSTGFTLGSFVGMW